MISIIIPTLNEAESLPKLLRYLKNIPSAALISEVIVSDGSSSDETIEIARSYGALVVRNEIAGRARQMNAAAKTAKGKILYFLHADSIPPKQFAEQIMKTCTSETSGGCFRLRFDFPHWFLRLNAWFTRFNWNAIRFGDQSLFVLQTTFCEIGGFREDHLVLEDQEIIRRIKTKGKFVVVPLYITTSARKYQKNGIYRLQFVFYYIYFLYRIGIAQPLLINHYRRLIS
jgi:rSAM/selenodomain-associated transferase 2